jgi:rhodanese-related sulfurtransferase
MIRVAGHVPGAANIPWSQAANEDGTFKSTDELRALYGAKGITGDDKVIAYCRIGERSSRTWFVLSELLGSTMRRTMTGRGPSTGAWLEFPWRLEPEIEGRGGHCGKWPPHRPGFCVTMSWNEPDPTDRPWSTFARRRSSRMRSWLPTFCHKSSHTSVAHPGRSQHPVVEGRQRRRDVQVSRGPVGALSGAG